MKCPKCKNEISENSLKCSHCGARIATLCKKCNAYNLIYNIKCVSCDEELLKLCPECKAVNFPNAEKCRKCGISFVKSEEGELETENRGIDEQMDGGIDFESQPSIPQDVQPSAHLLNSSTHTYTQQKAKAVLVEGLTAQDKKIISLNGPKGIGKSIVLKSAINELKDYEITWLLGECSAISQLTPLGLIQNILLNFFNITSFCSDNLKLKKESQKFFHSEFPTLSNEEIFNLLNLLYPSNTDWFENILHNKEKTFAFLNKVFKTIIERGQTVFIIDNFDLIDGLSYEFLYNLLNSEFATRNLKFVLTYEELRPARSYFYGPQIKDNFYLDISLSIFDKTQANIFIDQFLMEKPCPDFTKEKLFELSSGNPAVLEQFVKFLMDYESEHQSYDVEFPKTFKDVVRARLNSLKQTNLLAYQILSVATIQGKFYPALVNQIFNLDEDDFIKVLNLLQNSGFIIPVNEFAYNFKNSLLWETILEIVKEDKDFVVFNENMFSILSNYTLSSIATIAIIAQNLNQKLNAFNIWTQIIKHAAFIGDTNLYAISQKQCLILVDQLEELNIPLIKNNIYERLGKLISKTNPQEAMEYLPKAISNAKNNDDVLKELELTGYMANCCIKMGDYFGTIECIDFAIEKIDDKFELEVAMLKSRKLDALINIGNSGQIINLIDNEIMPIFGTHLASHTHKNISINLIYEAWLKTYLILANALILQGSNRSFEVIATMFELFKKNNFEEPLFICKTKLALSFANTIKGDIESSEMILEEIIKLYRTDIMDNEAISRWNLINILNNFIRKNYSGLKEELFEVVTFANNINDHFTKNILKTLLGKMFKDDENAKQALEIYSEQITYFAKEKNAIGALLTWYLIAQADLIVDGPDKAIDVAQKALDVAQGPKINNYLFITLLNKVIAEAYMAKSDYESAKVHLEKAIMVARKFELLDLLSRLYLLYGKYLQDMALVKSDLQPDYAAGSAKMYKKAFLLAQSMKNEYVLKNIEKAQSVLNSFCQLNGIFLK